MKQPADVVSVEQRAAIVCIENGLLFAQSKDWLLKPKRGEGHRLGRERGNGEPISEYEQQRLGRIAANEAHLIQLGLQKLSE